jgi:hypothetical protein
MRWRAMVKFCERFPQGLVFWPLSTARKKLIHFNF